MIFKQALIALCTLYGIKTNAQRIYFANAHELLIAESCTGALVHYNLNFEYYDEDTIQLVFKSSNIPSLRFYFGQKEIAPYDTLSLTNHDDFKKLSIEFLVNRNIGRPHIVFHQIVRDSIRENIIPVKLGHYQVRHYDQAIEVSSACQDSIYLVFPSIATQTDIRLNKHLPGGSVASQHRTYYCCWEGTRFKVASSDNSKYTASLSGCHSSKAHYEFELK